MADYPFNPNFPYPHTAPTLTVTPYLQLFPPRFSIPNKQVAVEPFPPAAKAEVKGGVVVPMNRSNLTGLRVVFDSGAYQVGWQVFVRSSLSYSTTYGKEVFEVEGQKFILIPEDQVILLDSQLASAQAPGTP